MLNRTAYPRPEYPRPDRKRGTIEGVDWLNLNGPWEFRFAQGQQGLEDEPWYQPDGSTWTEQIIVPFCWESLAAWGEADSAGNDNYYSTRVFLNPLEVTPANHREAARYEVGWYRREVLVPAATHPAWTGKRVILTIGAADFFTDGWCNGEHLGHNEGGYTPFEFDLTDHLETLPDGRRRGCLVLRVEDPMDNREQPVGKQWAWYTTTSGIWQTVFIEPRHAAHIQSFRITPDIDQGTARFYIECHNAQGCEIEIEIEPPAACADGEVYRETIPVQDDIAAEIINVVPVCLWDPNHPHLYNVTLRLKASRPLPDNLEQLRQEEQKSTSYGGSSSYDEVKTYFGMRKIDSGPPVTEGAEESAGADSPMVLRLNGEPRYLRGALYQSYFPDGIYTAVDEQVIKNDIAFAQKSGFNLLRVHIKIDDPILLYYADTMGMLLMCDFPNFGEGGDTPTGRRRFEEMMREGIRRDYNHPSIVAWCLFNETWGFGGQLELIKHFPHLPTRSRKKDNAGPGNGLSALNASTANEELKEQTQQVLEDATNDLTSVQAKLTNLSAHTWVQSIWELAKAIDPTRLIEDMSVVHWEHLEYFGHTVTDINSWHFYINEYEKAKEHIAKIVSDTYSGSSFNYVQGYAQTSQPLINSEYGGVGALDGDVDISWSFKFLTNEMRRYGQISAYIFTQLHDVEWEYNGFMNYDRTAKEFGYNPTIINAADTLPMDAAPIQRCSFGQRVSIPVSSSHFAVLPREEVSLEWRLSGMDAHGRMHADLDRGLVPVTFPHRRVAHAHTIELTMPEQPFLCTLSIDAVTAEGEVFARNFVQFHVAEGYLPEREERPGQLLLRALPQNWESADWPGFEDNREETIEKDYLWGDGAGFFEWSLPLHGADLRGAKRLRVLCEASSHLIPHLPGATPQTDTELHPTMFDVLLNGYAVYEAKLPNHPHDTRGVLSYLRGSKGSYGYLAHVTAEGDLLQQIAERSQDHLRLRLAVPHDAIIQGGLTILRRGMRPLSHLPNGYHRMVTHLVLLRNQLINR
jgi:beta-galactosidase/beta-glucuronidase